ncbi:MAG TPA: TrkA family potassium uptake protein [Candidatus Limnocylindrales bacterium]|nr:TrkA family potassium uptake protein [Candidatus Limnocylindrales bacterium]
MKTVIVGCGRVGSVLADYFDRAGHEVIVIDPVTRAFDRLPSGFGGSALRGDGTDEDTLRRAGAEGADIFIAMTEGDNRNVMAAQLAQEALGAKRVIAKINDPVRADAYADLGIATLCRTNLMADAVSEYLGMPVSGQRGIAVPRGSHPGGEHHEPLVGAATTPAAEGAAATPPATPAAAGQQPDTAPSGSRAGSATEV